MRGWRYPLEAVGKVVGGVAGDGQGGAAAPLQQSGPVQQAAVAALPRPRPGWRRCGRAWRYRSRSEWADAPGRRRRRCDPESAGRSPGWPGGPCRLKCRGAVQTYPSLLSCSGMGPDAASAASQAFWPTAKTLMPGQFICPEQMRSSGSPHGAKPGGGPCRPKCRGAVLSFYFLHARGIPAHVAVLAPEDAQLVHQAVVRPVEQGLTAALAPPKARISWWYRGLT